MAETAHTPDIPGIEGLELIGRGGFAVVYRGHQPAFRRDVAVKILGRSGLDADDRRRFERECQVMGMLSDHPGIVTLHDAGFTDDERPFMVMAFVSAGTLADQLRAGPFAWPEVTRLGVRLSGALETAHRAGVLHRDIKPANVLMSPYGGQLSDFGIARVQGGHETQSGVITASIGHAAPEILDGLRPTVAADVYSLGSTLYEALTGHAAFHRDTDEGLLPLVRRVISEPPPDLRPHGVPEPVVEAIETAMAKDPAQRFGSAEALGQALRKAQVVLGLSGTDLVIVGAAGSSTVDPDTGDVPIPIVAPTPPPPPPVAPASPAPTPPPPPTPAAPAPPAPPAPPTPTPPFPPTLAAPTPPPPPTPHAPVVPAPAYPTPPAAPAPRSRISLLVAAIVGIAAIVGGVVLFTRSGDDGPPEPEVAVDPGVTETTPDAADPDPTPTAEAPTPTPAPEPTPTPVPEPTPTPTPAPPPTPTPVPSVAVASTHPDAPAIGASLSIYVDGINNGTPADSYGILSASMQSGTTLASFADGVSTSIITGYTVTSVESLSGGANRVRVGFVSEQAAAFGPDGQTCSVWDLTYTMILVGGLWRIDSALNNAGSPTPC